MVISPPGVPDSGHIFRCLICHSPYAGDYGSEWHPFLVYLRQPIELGGTCPCGIEPSMDDIINPTFCLDGLQQGY